MAGSNILTFIKENWQPILGFATAIGTVIGYFLTRWNELAWKRTEFLCSQAHYLDNDPVLVETIKILEERHPTLKVNDIFDSESTLDEEKRKDYRQRFDKLLNFLWRLCLCLPRSKDAFKEGSRRLWMVFLAHITDSFIGGLL